MVAETMMAGTSPAIRNKIRELDGRPLTRLAGSDGRSWEFEVSGASAGQVLVLAVHSPDQAPGTGGIVGPIVLH